MIDDARRVLWLVAAGCLLVLDPLSTAVAVELGLGVEANPLLAPVVHAGDWVALAAVKAAVLAGVWAVWRALPEGRAADWVPAYAAASGFAVVASNLVMVLLSAGVVA